MLLFLSQAAAGAVKLEGDVITANGSILSIEDPRAGSPGFTTRGGEPCESGGGGMGGGGGNTIGSLTDIASVCSCNCVSCNPFAKPKNYMSRNKYRLVGISTNKYRLVDISRDREKHRFVGMSTMF